MTSLLDEELVELNRALAMIPGRPALATLYRWVRRGCRARSGERIALESIRAGGRRFTSREALQRFFQALDDPAAASVAAEATSGDELRLATLNARLDAKNL